MDHFYKNITGFFDFEQIYLEQIQRIEKDGYFVELGTYLGKSTAFMATEIINSKKNIRFDAIEWWDYHYRKTKENLKNFSDKVNVIKGDSRKIFTQYKDDSLDFVFIDTSHTEEDTLLELQGWYPKIKIGGVIAGHDFDHPGYPGVRIAVEKFFGKDYEVKKNECAVFLHTKK